MVENQTKECPNCGESYESLGRHWATCGYPELSDKQKEIMVGCLMGDGTIDNRDRDHPRFTLVNTNPDYARHVWEKLQPFATFTSYSPKRENRSRNYKVRVTHPWVSTLAEWYGGDGKRFPNVDLSPTVLKHWYCCDGSKQVNSAGGERFQIGAANEEDRPDHILYLFKDTPVDVSMSGHDIYCSYNDTTPWEYMGEPPEGMGFKWP